MWQLVNYHIDCISSLSLLEQCEIIGSYHQVNHESVDLSRYSAAQIAAMKASKKRQSVTYLGLTFVEVDEFECSTFDFICTLFNSFDRHGVLPFEGTLADQPNKIIQIFNTLRALNREAENRERKRQELLAKRRK